VAEGKGGQAEAEEEKRRGLGNLIGKELRVAEP
jgi:hypothetical protein